ncbi:MAG: hypothetical protein HW414_723 [Dehalococcoidia bacterium]|nr:hypothetical protein [Dehalococcoidia bacterium]
MMSLCITILNVIMNERVVVHQFDGYCCGENPVTLASTGLGGQQAKGGAKGLAAEADKRFTMFIQPSEMIPEHVI